MSQRSFDVNYLDKRRNRLVELVALRPQYAEVFDFYRALYAFLEEEDAGILVTAPDPEEGRVRQQDGFPLLSAAALRIAVPQAQGFLARLAEFLSVHGQEGTAEMRALGQAFGSGSLDVSALLRATLERHRPPVIEAAQRIGAAPQMIEFLCATTLAFALHRAREAGLTTPGTGWDKGYCPLCGGLPAMGELAGEEGRMTLHCGTCSSAWEVSRLRCTTCGTTDLARLEYFTAAGEKGYRVNICRQCNSYLKVVDSREVGAGLPMDIEDISTLHLDLLAQREGFSRVKEETAALRARRDEVLV